MSQQSYPPAIQALIWLGLGLALWTAGIFAVVGLVQFLVGLGVSA